MCTECQNMQDIVNAHCDKEFHDNMRGGVICFRVSTEI